MIEAVTRCYWFDLMTRLLIMWDFRLYILSMLLCGKTTRKTGSHADGGLYSTAQARSADSFHTAPLYLLQLEDIQNTCLSRSLTGLSGNWGNFVDGMQARLPKSESIFLWHCWTWGDAALKMWRLLKYSELGAFGVHRILISALPIKAIPVHRSPSFTTARTEV